MAPHTPQRSSRPGEPVALLDHAPPHTPQRSSRPGEPVALLDHAPPTPPSVRRAPGNPWRSSITRPPHPPALVAPRQSRGAPRSPDGGLNHTTSSVREVASPKRPIEYPGSPV